MDSSRTVQIVTRVMPVTPDRVMAPVAKALRMRGWEVLETDNHDVGDFRGLRMWSWYAPVYQSILNGLKFSFKDILVFHNWSDVQGVRERKAASNCGSVFVPCKYSQEQASQAGIGSIIVPLYVVEKAFVEPRGEYFCAGIIGYGKATNKRWDLIRKVCQHQEIVLVDWTSGDKLPDYTRSFEPFYAQISVVVCASTTEGGPLPPLEALVRGRLVVTTRVGMMSEIVENGARGVFFHDGTSDGLAQALTEAREAWKSGMVGFLPERYTSLERLGKDVEYGLMLAGMAGRNEQVYACRV